MLRIAAGSRMAETIFKVPLHSTQFCKSSPNTRANSSPIVALVEVYVVAHPSDPPIMPLQVSQVSAELFETVSGREALIIQRPAADEFIAAGPIEKE